MLAATSDSISDLTEDSSTCTKVDRPRSSPNLLLLKEGFSNSLCWKEILLLQASSSSVVSSSTFGVAASTNFIIPSSRRFLSLKLSPPDTFKSSSPFVISVSSSRDNLQSWFLTSASATPSEGISFAGESFLTTFFTGSILKTSVTGPTLRILFFPCPSSIFLIIVEPVWLPKTSSLVSLIWSSLELSSNTPVLEALQSSCVLSGVLSTKIWELFLTVCFISSFSAGVGRSFPGWCLSLSLRTSEIFWTSFWFLSLTASSFSRNAASIPYFAELSLWFISWGVAKFLILSIPVSSVPASTLTSTSIKLALLWRFNSIIVSWSPACSSCLPFLSPGIKFNPLLLVPLFSWCDCFRSLPVLEKSPWAAFNESNFLSLLWIKTELDDFLHALSLLELSCSNVWFVSSCEPFCSIPSSFNISEASIFFFESTFSETAGDTVFLLVTLLSWTNPPSLWFSFVIIEGYPSVSSLSWVLLGSWVKILLSTRILSFSAFTGHITPIEWGAAKTRFSLFSFRLKSVASSSSWSVCWRCAKRANATSVDDAGRSLITWGFTFWKSLWPSIVLSSYSEKDSVPCSSSVFSSAASMSSDNVGERLRRFLHVGTLVAFSEFALDSKVILLSSSSLCIASETSSSVCPAVSASYPFWKSSSLGGTASEIPPAAGLSAK